MSTNNASPAIRGIQGLLLKPTAVHNFVEAKGVVYTKPWVVDLLLDVAGYRPENNLVDKTAVEPAAGNGAFLASMISRLVSSCRSQGRSLDDCRQSIMAYELDNRSAMAARQTAIGALTKENVEPEKALQLAEGWINVGDYLLEGALLEADFVIGNPPYVRLEDIPEDTANAYRNSYPTMCGRADLYVAFFEAALHQLKHDGVCAFICADRWMKNQYGSQLRQLISSSYSVDFIIEMHEANAFEDEVDAYPAITVIRRKRQQITVVAKALSSAEEVESRIISELLTETKQGRPVVLPSGLSAAAVDHWFEGSEPWPCSSPQQLKLLRELEGRFGPLESDRRRTKVGIGVATGNDEVFITRDPSIVEQSRLLKLALAKDISSGVMTWSGHYLINPWEKEGLVSLENFPRLQSYFEKHSESVRKRNISRRNPVDWYRTIDRVNNDLSGIPKLYIADISNLLTPVLDSGISYPHHNLYFVQSEEWDLEVLGGLLMSAVAQFFVECYGVRMRGGYFRFQAQYLRRIRVPSPDSLSAEQSEQLQVAFRNRDRESATAVALDIYGIRQQEMEIARGH